MGHEVPGMRGVYTHIAPEWRTDLIDGLQRLWEVSLDAPGADLPRSSVPLLDRLLAARAKDARPHLAPRIGQEDQQPRLVHEPGPLTCLNTGVSDGI